MKAQTSILNGLISNNCILQKYFISNYVTPLYSSRYVMHMLFLYLNKQLDFMQNHALTTHKFSLPYCWSCRQQKVISLCYSWNWTEIKNSQSSNEDDDNNSSIARTCVDFNCVCVNAAACVRTSVMRELHDDQRHHQNRLVLDQLPYCSVEMVLLTWK